jgi:hypothetical protein
MLGARCTAVSLAPDCPARDHHVQSGPAGRRMQSAAPTLDPGDHSPRFGAYEETGEN